MRTRFLSAVAALGLLAGVAACNDFLACDECTVDPNRPTIATNTQLFVGVQSNLWALLSSDPARVTGLWARHFEGGLQQYVQIYNYGYSEQTTNGFHSSLYIGGGLVDVRRLQEGARAANDNLLLGIAQVQEALLIGTGASLFGDLVYSEALQGEGFPALDPQLEIYDALQTLLSEAITNMAATGASNVGPRGADLAYGGDRAKWTRLAHTLKARLYLHTAEVRPQAYQSALTEARLGITAPADNFVAAFSGAANEQNFWYQFAVVQREGYLLPDPFFVNLLESRNDPRLEEYFNEDLTGISDERLEPDFAQPLVTANENLLIWAEAAYRTGGAEAEARQQLDAARALAGLGPVPATLAGQPLLNEILTEKYIAMFQNIEAWNDYKRTCTPNLPPVDATRKIPARLYYDAAEQQTNPNNIPVPSQQPTRNPNDPRNLVSEGTGAVCLGQ
ncbi:MAG: SusD/RagB family nutrient-binding outer membrane lipoprotein [Gemmatimonadaceae bacterium]